MKFLIHTVEGNYPTGVKADALCGKTLRLNGKRPARWRPACGRCLNGLLDIAVRERAGGADMARRLDVIRNASNPATPLDETLRAFTSPRPPGGAVPVSTDEDWIAEEVEARRALNATHWWQWSARNAAARRYKAALYMGALREIREGRA